MGQTSGSAINLSRFETLEGPGRARGLHLANDDFRAHLEVSRARANPDLERWFRQKRWKPFAFQLRAWEAFRNGQSGLVHAPTGVGKTYSVWIPALEEWLTASADTNRKTAPPIQLLWVTPLRALANDTAAAMLKPVRDLALPWAVELRTGDTSASVRARQRKQFPSALVTTPESLSLLLSYPETREKLSSLKTIIVDEWHELLGTKRGVQTELCLARMRHWFPRLRTWGLSATLGNLEESLQVLLGTTYERDKAALISADLKKDVQIKTMLPRNLERFPWAGHVGLNLLPQVIKRLQAAQTTLLFTNTRSQTEIWFRALQEARPDWSQDIALHHGSVDRELREQVEDRLRAGTVRCVVCTSSLDLGVDFPPVEQVIQIGAPKGVARMLQRAGRSGHRSGAVSRLFCVPAHALELVEFAAVREAIAEGQLETRTPLERPLDVLVQHLVTVALGGGFDEQALRREVQSAHAYRHLSDPEWQWCMDFVTRGGQALQAYPQFKRVVKDNGLFSMHEPQLAHFHRMSIGTITSDSAVIIKFLKGGSLGTTEESFVARLRRGDRFNFAGHALEFVRLHDMVAYVRRAKKSAGLVPQWMGGKMPLSSQLAAVVRRKLSEAREGVYVGREMEAVQPVLELQKRWSSIPDTNELLIERVQLREGTHHFVFPFAGRLVHEGLAALLAHRISLLQPRSLSVTVNDYGFGLLSPTQIELEPSQWKQVLSPDNLVTDLLACMNSAELAKRQFREIARVAGLVFQGFPGRSKTVRQLQASSGLFYDVFMRYDPANLLLDQARREVLERQLEIQRMKQALERISTLKLAMVQIHQLTPLSFPLWASFVQASVSSERWTERIDRMVAQLEAAAKSEGI
jgi:ATP-dependent helicase Lhr and Lhr-like helicase